MTILGTPAPESGGAPPVDKGADVGDVPQWRLMLRRFRQSKLAVAATIILAFMYLAAAAAPFLSPNDHNELNQSAQHAAPSKLTWDGGPAMCGVTQELDRETFTYEYTTNCDETVPIHVFGRGHEYEFLGLFTTDRHLLTVDEPVKLYLWGADTQGRDVFARTVHGARVSLTIGLVGVAISTVLAAVVGAISGFFGGAIDNGIQRVLEVIMAIPTLPLWATLAAILPRDLSVTQRYFFITLILSLIFWANIARQVRGKVMSYAAADYVAAARVAGSSNSRIILTHLLPNSMSHIVVVATLAIPATILAETALSFLGIGMLPPAVSWGVLLQDAQRADVVTNYPWLLIPALAVILAVTCFQLLGDGVRDAVDPYG